METNLFIPLRNVSLSKQKVVDLGFGFSIAPIPDEYLNILRSEEKLSTGYKKSIEQLTVGLMFLPFEGHPIQLVYDESAEYHCIFTCFLLRLATGIPLDLPFWFFSANQGNFMGHDRTLIRTYRNDPGYIYPIDGGDYDETIILFRNNIEGLLRRIIRYSEQPEEEDRLIRAVEFASYGYQTRQITPRLVNMVTFLEILFSSSRVEISHQLSERIAWYLAPQDSEERNRVYEQVREIYNERSGIVHGDNPMKSRKNLSEILVEVESLSTRIFNAILKNKHIDEFTMTEDRRKRELKKLGLGVNCAYSYTENA